MIYTLASLYLNLKQASLNRSPLIFYFTLQPALAISKGLIAAFSASVIQ